MIQFERERTPQEFLTDLRAAAQERWGSERLEALQPGLEAAAEALCFLARATLAPLEAEPDFIGGVEREGDV